MASIWKLSAAALFGLAGCAAGMSETAVPYDARPVEFGHGMDVGDYRSYESARIAGGGSPAGGTEATEPARVISSDELAAAGLPVAGGGLPAAEPIGAAPLDAMAPGTAAPANHARISDEQSFEAVSARETIESDAERLARQAEAYQVIPPAPVPTRSGADRPNIVAFALSTRNAVGETVYSRSGLNLAGRARRACADYPSSDQAQEAFLARGGPEVDRLGVDPDGDGFACSWDPAPFRAARG